LGVTEELQTTFGSSNVLACGTPGDGRRVKEVVCTLRRGIHGKHWFYTSAIPDNLQTPDTRMATINLFVS